MATQFKDGSFSETKELPEALNDFLNYVEADQAKAFFVGTRGEINAIKEEADLKTQVKELQARLGKLESDKPLSSDSIHLPTSNDVLMFGKVEE